MSMSIIDKWRQGIPIHSTPEHLVFVVVSTEAWIARQVRIVAYYELNITGCVEQCVQHLEIHRDQAARLHLFRLIGRFACLQTPVRGFDKIFETTNLARQIEVSLKQDKDGRLLEQVLILVSNLATTNFGPEPLTRINIVALLGDLIGALGAPDSARLEALRALRNVFVGTFLSPLERWKQIDVCVPLVKQLTDMLIESLNRRAVCGEIIVVLEIVMTLAQLHGSLEVFFGRMVACDGEARVKRAQLVDPQRANHILQACKDMHQRAAQAAEEAALAAAPPPQGYPADMFDPPLTDQLECGICSEIVRDPPNLGGCAHLFCRDCIRVWSKKQLTCPSCRIPFVKSLADCASMQPNFFVCAHIAQAPIVCPQRVANGCTWRSSSMGTDGRLLLAHEKETCAAYMSKHQDNNNNKIKAE